MSDQLEPVPVVWNETVVRDPDAHVTLIPCQTQGGDPVALLLDDTETTALAVLLSIARTD